MTVRLEAISEMDPGLKLIIQRRQVTYSYIYIAQYDTSNSCININV